MSQAGEIVAGIRACFYLALGDIIEKLQIDREV